MRNRPEHDLQCSIVQWAKLHEGQYPELEALYAIKNEGLRSLRLGKDFVESGMKKGMPDLCLPVPKGGYGALFIELKSGNGKLSEFQKEVLRTLMRCGNLCLVAKTYERVTQVIVDYLKGKYERSN